MRLLVVGSEHWSSTDWQSLSRVVGQQTRLVNSYGLTESTIDSTFADQPGSIGRAFANTSVFVLDAYGNPAPVGIPGELHIGGANVARGYLERPDLTAERFVPDAASGRCGRLYRTGDRARWRPDGTLELLGRIDNQLKVRGVRLEPAEIEAVLRRYPAVDDVAVTVREERLVAFFTAADAPPSPANLRAFARLRLPDTLVPSAYVELKRLPRLASGKLDRSALRASAVAPRVSLRPLTADEARMAALWSGVLNIEAENIGPDDDFFALGGHSLLAMRVMSQVRLAFNTDAPLRALFEEPVLGDFTRRVARQRLTAVRTPVSSVVRVARDAYRVLEH
jgi:acyl-CoA synthetase (AMP-forming)/AMP-acid ligase II/acyl carrier protein